PGGRRVACGTERGRVFLCDLPDGAAVADWQAHPWPVTSLAVNPAGTRLASASLDGEVRLWQWPTGRLERALAPGVGRVHKVAWSRDGRFLAAAGACGVVLWDLERDAASRRLSRHVLAGSSVAFGADTVALCGPDNTIEVRDL